MILNIFVVLMAITITLIFAGKTLKNPPLTMAGFLFGFILGLVLMLGGLEYVSGEELTVTNNYVNDTLTNSTTNKILIYSDYDSEIISGIQVNHVFGFFLCIVMVLGFIITLFNLESFETEADVYRQWRTKEERGEE